jgi:hypothetical protein
LELPLLANSGRAGRVPATSGIPLNSDILALMSGFELITAG